MSPTVRARDARMHLVPNDFEPASAVVYRLPEPIEDATAVLANLESRGVAYVAPVDVQRQLWARGRSFAKLSHRMACRGPVIA